MSVTVVSVAVEQTAYHFDKPYDYFLPPEFDADNNMDLEIALGLASF